MPNWEYVIGGKKEVTVAEIDNIMGSLICFKCGKELHSDDCPFAKLRAELNALKES